MNKLYLFSNTEGNGRTGWGEDCYSMAEDGRVLGNHICSTTEFMYYDLVKRRGRKEHIEAHFKKPLSEIEIIILDSARDLPTKVYERNQTRSDKS